MLTEKLGTFCGLCFTNPALLVTRPKFSQKLSTKVVRGLYCDITYATINFYYVPISIISKGLYLFNKNSCLSQIKLLATFRENYHPQPSKDLEEQIDL